jgi:hypothetical protein
MSLYVAPPDLQVYRIGHPQLALWVNEYVVGFTGLSPANAFTERFPTACRIPTRAQKQLQKAAKAKGIGYGKMKEATDVLKIVGIVLLALFVLAVGVPVVLAAAGVAIGVLGLLVGLAIALIKIAIVVAIIYLIVVGIRAVLR